MELRYLVVVVAAMWKMLCNLMIYGLIGGVLILITMAVLKQVFGISTKQLIKKLMGGAL